MTSLTSRQYHRTSQLSAQRGVALLMVLMVTLVIVALSVSLAIGVFSGQKNARVTADHAIARQAAEAALRDAELDLLCQTWSPASQSFGFNNSAPTASLNPRSYCINPIGSCKQIGSTSATPTCVDGLISAPLSAGGAVPAARTDLFSNTACYREFSTVTGQPKYEIAGLPTALQPRQPRYSVEVLTKNYTGQQGEDIPVYRITARGYGRGNASNTTVDLESIFRPCDQ